LYDGTLLKSTVMANLSTARKIGIIARVAAKQASRTRTFRATLQAGKVAAAHWSRIARQLWLEVTGFVFLSLAAIGALAFVRELAHYPAGESSSKRVVVAILFTLLFAWFGITSFWRVRKKR
jgi:hypothetical protein